MTIKQIPSLNKLPTTYFQEHSFTFFLKNTDLSVVVKGVEEDSNSVPHVGGAVHWAVEALIGGEPHGLMVKWELASASTKLKPKTITNALFQSLSFRSANK